MWPDSFKIDVSRETIEKLEIYHALLLKWQKAINLVSNKTIDEAWVRHFADSAQISPHVSRESKTLVDLGSGAGFPGLVLAILRPEIEIHLIESDERKCQFLRTVSRETNVDVIVHNMRIEEAYDFVRPDFVTARALSELGMLLGYIYPWAVDNPGLECLFLKGARAEEELAAAAEGYSFQHQNIVSATDSQARLLKLSHITKI